MNSKDYWEKREAEQLKHNLIDEKEYEKRLKQIYEDMLENVQNEINDFYIKYARGENITIQEAKRRISKSDIEKYKNKAERYVKEKNFSKQANEEMRLYNATMKINRLEMLKANIGLELVAGHDELEKFTEEVLNERTVEELERQAGILGETIYDNAETANSIVNASFHNATFSNRIWMYQAEMKADLEKLLQQGLIQGKNPRALARELRRKFNVSIKDSERLMRTELARVQTDAQKKAFEENGFEEYTFIVNGGCCEICEGIKDKHFKVKDMQPGLNAPPMHPHCRCSTAAYEDSGDYEAWLNFLANGGTSVQWEELKKNPTKQELESTAQTLNNEKTSIKTLDNGFNSGKIKTLKKSVEIPNDCDYLLKADTNFTDKDIDVEVLRSINNSISNRKKEKNDFSFDEIKVARFADDDKSVFVTNYEVFGGRRKNQLYLNKNYFYGISLDNLNSLVAQQYNSGWWKSKNVEDLVNHEIMHARINNYSSFEKVELLYQMLDEDERTKGFCRLVDAQPSEFLNEMYVAMCNNEDIEQKYIDIFKEYSKEFLGE